MVVKEASHPEYCLFQLSKLKKKKTKMAVIGQTFCKFHQYGRYKFYLNCRHFHTQDTCFVQGCDTKSCTKRHPRLCLYYSTFNHSSFGSTCSYLHVDLKNYSDLITKLDPLKEELKNVLINL